MNKLETAKIVVELLAPTLDCGIFDSRNIVDDPMDNLINDDGLIIDACFEYSYLEVFGLSDDEFEELSEYYEECRKHKNTDSNIEEQWQTFLRS